ncbi:MAG: N-acetylmuramoyl-L-alanine amidase CwlD [Clostridia bacterium]|nr:N-acetylmuramoyl-L-alanine amidase CwlD [Clostridia bacterium]
MILILKKRNAFLIAAIFLLVVYIAGACINNFAFSRRVSLSCYGKKIVLDAGHGEPDGGAVGKTGVKEQELNLKIAKILQGFLEQCGMEVVMTRADEQGIYDSDGTIRNKKRSDMSNREKLMNDSDADVFLSIHMNKFTDSKYSGPQVFYSSNKEESKELAQILQEELIAVLNPESQREIKKATNDIYLLKKAKVPAVLVECGFLSNAKEEEKLKDEEYQKEVAWAIYCSIIKYFSLEAS